VKTLTVEIPLDAADDVAALRGALLAARATELAEARRRGDRLSFGYGSESAREGMSAEVVHARRRGEMLDRLIAALDQPTPGAAASSQLRIFRIADGHLDDFVAAWTDGVLPLRRAFGFDVDAWTASEGRFIWLLRHPGPETFEAADARYYASPERRSLDPDPAQWIVEQEAITIVPVVPGG
jgi:hypothetical protein